MDDIDLALLGLMVGVAGFSVLAPVDQRAVPDPADARPISVLAVALVLVTAAAVAVVARGLVADLSWAAACALGAIVSPTDPPTAKPVLIRRLGIRGDDDEQQEEEELRARLAATDAALERLTRVRAAESTRDDAIERLQGVHQSRRRRLEVRAGVLDDDGRTSRSGRTSRHDQHGRREPRPPAPYESGGDGRRTGSSPKESVLHGEHGGGRPGRGADLAVDVLYVVLGRAP